MEIYGRLAILALSILAIVGLAHIGTRAETTRAGTMVICPTWPPCWYEGQPIQGRMPPGYFEERRRESTQAPPVINPVLRYIDGKPQ